MASGSKITQLTQATSLEDYDLIPVVTGSPTTPVTKSVRRDNFLTPFFIGSGSSGMVVNNTGTATPQFIAEQSGTGDVLMRLGLSGSTTFTFGIDNSDADKFKFAQNPSGGAGIGSNTLITITTDGLIGIGTTSPSRKLQVVDSSDIPALFRSTDPTVKIDMSDDTTVNATVLGRTGDETYIYSNNIRSITLDDAGNVEILNGDIYTVAWTDYSATSTIVGWSAYTTKAIHYKKLGNLVYVTYALVGTSNSVATSFTVPYVNSGSTIWHKPAKARNNGTFLDGAQTSYMNDSGSVCTFNIDEAGITGWTSSGSKAVYGQFFYETS